jgi:glycosyltransferase involved in cell wall biosynthesis
VNILQILPSVNVGGAGLIALRIAEYLHRSSRPASVWSPGDGPLFREAERLNLGPRVFDPSPAFAAGRLGTAIGNLGFYKALRREGPGVAHVHSPYLYRAMRPALRLAGLRGVVHVQLEEDRDGLRWAFRRPPELIVTCSRSLIDYVRGCLPPRLRARQWIEAVPNAVDTTNFRPGDRAEAKARVGAPAATPLVLMLANLAPHKGQETTIRAVASLKRRGVDVTCWLAGVERREDGYVERLGELITGLGVQDRVTLLGQRGDASDLLRAADVFLLPSTNEGLPLSILEAQATRVPVLAAPTAGIPEVVVDGETGYLIPPADADGYADRIASLLANPGTAGRIVDNARRLVCERYNWEAFCRSIEALYESVARDRSPGRRIMPRVPAGEESW